MVRLRVEGEGGGRKAANERIPKRRCCSESGVKRGGHRSRESQSCIASFILRSRVFGVRDFIHVQRHFSLCFDIWYALHSFNVRDEFSGCVCVRRKKSVVVCVGDISSFIALEYARSLGMIIHEHCLSGSVESYFIDNVFL